MITGYLQLCPNYFKKDRQLADKIMFFFTIPCVQGSCESHYITLNDNVVQLGSSYSDLADYTFGLV